MNYKKLIEDLKLYATRYASDSTLGRMIEETDDLMFQAAEAIEQLLKNTKLADAQPLSIEQLRQMNGRPAWWDGGDGEGCWGIIEVDSDGPYAGKPFFEGRWKNMSFSWDIKENKMMIYARELSREEWEAQKGRDKQ